MESAHPYGLSIENIWKDVSEERIEEISQFWKANQLIGPNVDVVARAKQGLYVARNQDNTMVALTTAYPQFIKQLGNYLFAYRCVILPSYRYPGLLTKLTMLSRDYLESISTSFEPRCVGLITEVQNTSLAQYKKPIYPGTEFVFLGYTADGSQIRGYYFKQAEL